MLSIPGPQQLPKLECPRDFLQENGEKQACKDLYAFGNNYIALGVS